MEETCTPSIRSSKSERKTSTSTGRALLKKFLKHWIKSPQAHGMSARQQDIQKLRNIEYAIIGDVQRSIDT